jgi:formate hydrogenlyase subunit 3/multisubunit Na+/H+ antiporter MnhD subunit
LCRRRADEYSVSMDAFRILIIGLLAAILISLGTGLYYLSAGKGDSGKLLRALTIRIALSMALFLLLMIAWRTGLISPVGSRP